MNRRRLVEEAKRMLRDRGFADQEMHEDFAIASHKVDVVGWRKDLKVAVECGPCSDQKVRELEAYFDEVIRLPHPEKVPAAGAASARSVVPRGFSRFYVLSLLRDRALTGKEIMEETEGRTRGAWRPSPGLVYPLLGRLLSEGLIEEGDRGYRVTAKGEKALEDYGKAYGEFDRRFGAVMRLGMAGAFMARDLVDRVAGLLSMFREDISRLGAEQRARYRSFLRAELSRMEEEEEGGAR